MSGAVWHYVDSAGPGGIESHLAALLPALRAIGVPAELVLHADHGPHPLRDSLDASGAPHRSLRGGLPELLARLRAERPAILHTHGYKAALLGRAARLLGGPPVVSTMHSGEAGRGRVGLYNRLDALTSPVSRLILVSPALRRRHPRADFIPNGVAVPPEPPAPGAAVAFVGRLSPEKGPLDFARLARLVPGAAFAAFGDGPLRGEAEAEAAGAVAFRGAVASMDPHWAEVGLLVMPSRFEGMPMAALEAMARGVPVAAYAVGSLPDLLGEGRGFLAAPGDLRGLADAVLAWAATPADERATLGCRLRAHVAARYEIDACARATARLYAELLGDAPPTAAAA